MTLVWKIIAASIAGFVVTAVIIGLTVPKRNKNTTSDMSSKATINRYSDCRTDKCEPNIECIKVDGKPPTCTCMSGFMSIETETHTGSEKICHKKCDSSSDCETGQVCKEFVSGIVCIASANLDSCEDVKCDASFVCEVVDSHPKCRCPPNTLLIETEPDGTDNRRCRKSCTEMDVCVPGTLCFRHPNLGEFYCEDRDLLPAESCTGDDVKCSSTTECLTKNDNIDCYCKEGARTLITRTETGSERICGGTECIDQLDCSQTTTLVCNTDPYTLDVQCVDPAHVESCDHVHCEDNYACLADFSCGCLDGETEYLGYCHKKCTENQECKTARLGDCNIDAGRCVRQIPRDSSYTEI